MKDAPDTPFTFEGEVFEAELEEIRRRRAGGSLERPPPPEGRYPSTAHNLVGMACSGGGIRSATFNLGILQGLARHGVFGHLDYLSTVSGGGYLGGAISALMRKSAAKFPFLEERSATESAPLRHLRDASNYLAPDGKLDMLTFMMVVARGIVINVLTLLPGLMLLAVIVSLAYGPALVASSYQLDLVVTPWAAGAFALYAVVSPLLTEWGRVRSHTVFANPERAYRLRKVFYRSFSLGALAVGLVFFVELQPVILHFCHQARAQFHIDGRLIALVSALGSLASGASLQNTSSPSPLWAAVSGRLRLLVAGLLGPMLPLAMYLGLLDWLVYHSAADARGTAVLGDLASSQPALMEAIPELALGTAACALLIFVWLWVDVNDHSGHHYWRDRLSAAYLMGGDRGDVIHDDAVRLSDLAERGSLAPYHLINTTMNLTGDRRESNLGRSGDFFLWSKHFVGGERTGYVPTSALEAVLPHTNLGTAVAISSAAAAPNMGAATISSLTFLMTLLNVRMGYWTPHPDTLRRALGLFGGEGWRDRLAAYIAKAGKRGLGRRAADIQSWHARPAAIYREMLGQITSNTRLVNVSDGGHLENLGVYELLRRRCKYIIVGDGEADGEMRFGALSALCRYARIDLGVEIDIPLDGLRLGEDGLSRAHAAIGLIRYPPTENCGEEIGFLLYIKASLTPQEHVLLREYHESHPTFPHESTADQFFSEAQFEAYRALGYTIVDEMLSEALRRPVTDNPNTTCQASMTFHEVIDLFRILRVQLAPENWRDSPAPSVPIRTGEEPPERLSEVDALYADQYPELWRDGTGGIFERMSEDPVLRQGILRSVTRQLDEVDRVRVALRLYDRRSREDLANAGWMNLFRRWARSPLFHWAFVHLAPSYGVGFRLFCRNELQIHLSTGWKELDAKQLPATRLLSRDESARLSAAHELQPHALVLGSFLEDSEAQVKADGPYGWAMLLEQEDGSLVLGPHGLRPGTDDFALYELFLCALASETLRRGLPMTTPTQEQLDIRFRHLLDVETMAHHWAVSRPSVPHQRPHDLAA